MGFPLNPVEGGFYHVKLTPDMYSPLEPRAAVSQKGRVVSTVQELPFDSFITEMSSWAPSPVPSSFFSALSSAGPPLHSTRASFY